ncbi:MAG: hypothetical protein M3271_06115 [Actinomycetota bacterium]|nr:hypothetical protein [Actinomycetota bacterium]
METFDDAMEPLVLTPHTVVARWSSTGLVVHAAGQEGGITEVAIAQRPKKLGPPEFEITGRISPFAGLFPYGVTCEFALAERPDEIVIVTREGAQTIPVR